MKDFAIEMFAGMNMLGKVLVILHVSGVNNYYKTMFCERNNFDRLSRHLPFHLTPYDVQIETSEPLKLLLHWTHRPVMKLVVLPPSS
jgi:hypothetical protein